MDEMEINLNEGFKETIINILKYCLENNTDSVSLEIELPTTIIETDMAFRVKRKADVDSDM